MKNSRRNGLLLILIIVLFMGYLCHSMTRNMQQQDNSFDSVVHVEEYSEKQESTVILISTEVSASTDTSEQEKTETDMSKPEKVKDGTIYEMLMSGNFECLKGDGREYIEHAYEIMVENGTAVWYQIDINGDGTDDPLLQETYENLGNRKAIAGIIDCKEGQEKCAFWDINNYSEFMFCGATGELMYYARRYGDVFSMEAYTHYYYDSEWNRIEDYTIVAYRIRIDAAEDRPIGTDWIETYPDMAENGDYYRLYVGEDETGKALTFEEFVEIYETETGFAFQNDSYSPWK